MAIRTNPPSPLLECLLDVGPLSTVDETMRAMPVAWLSACGHGVDVVREPGETDRNADVIGCFMALWGWFGPQSADGLIEVEEDVFLSTYTAFGVAASTLALGQLGLFKVDPVQGWLDSKETLSFAPMPPGPQCAIVFVEVERFGLMEFAASVTLALVRSHGCL